MGQVIAATADEAFKNQPTPQNWARDESRTPFPFPVFRRVGWAIKAEKTRPDVLRWIVFPVSTQLDSWDKMFESFASFDDAVRFANLMVDHALDGDRRQILVARYKNHRGVVASRSLIPLSRMHWGSNQWHPEPQWLMDAIDCEKRELRTFSLKNLKFL